MNNMTAEDWNQIDGSSRALLSAWLSTKPNVSDIGESSGNCCWDISCSISGKTTAIEVKDRTFESTKYGDVFAEDIKQECIANNWHFDTALAVNVFTDNIIAVANMFDKDAQHFQRMCPLTSRVKGASKQYVKKNCLSLPQKLKIKFTRESGTLKFEKI